MPTTPRALPTAPWWMPGTTANASFAGGQLDLSANAGQGSNAITEDAYVDLPNGIVSSAASSGTNGAITFEFWATVATQRTWQRFGDFGTSNTGENTSPGGAMSQYILITPNSGRFAQRSGNDQSSDHQRSRAERRYWLGRSLWARSSMWWRFTIIRTPPAGPNGTMALYLQGNLDWHGCDSPRHQFADGQRQQQLARPLAVAGSGFRRQLQ